MARVVRVPRSPTAGLGDAVAEFLADRDLAPTTRRIYGVALAALVADLGPGISPPGRVTPPPRPPHAQHQGHALGTGRPLARRPGAPGGRRGRQPTGSCSADSGPANSRSQMHLPSSEGVASDTTDKEVLDVVTVKGRKNPAHDERR